MLKRLQLVGSNLVSDSEFRKKLAGRDAGVEVQMILEDLISSLPSSVEENRVESMTLVKQQSDNNKCAPNPNYTRDQMKITLKIFLPLFEPANLRKAVETALERIQTDKVDTLFLAVPFEAFPIIGIGSGGKEEEQAEAYNSLLKLWTQVETLIQEGKIDGAGLCDLHPPLFIRLYQEANIKPSGVQVNLKSCCVVPEELSQFAKANKVTLLTHSDPQELIPDDLLRKLLYPKLGREAGHFSANWIARYQIQLKDRGVLLERRYLLQIDK